MCIRDSLNLAQNRAEYTSSFVDDYGNSVLSGTPLAGVPEKLASAGAVWKHDGWRASLEGRFVGRQYIDLFAQGVTSHNVIGGHAIVNLGLSRLFALGSGSSNQSLKVGLNIDNLLDRRYLNTAFTDTDFNGNPFVRGVYGAPRAISGSVSYGF